MLVGKRNKEDSEKRQKKLEHSALGILEEMGGSNHLHRLDQI